jgi:hypothetical protein
MIMATYREPFGMMPRVLYLEDGQNLHSMRKKMVGLPETFDKHGFICINGHPVPRDLWGMVTPKPQSVTEVTFHMPPRDGGDRDGGKNLFAIIASIALTVVGGWVAAGGLAGKFGLGARFFAANTVGAYALAGGVSLVGSLLLSALVPPPSIDQSSTLQNPGAASADGNVLEPNTTIPRVLGERKVYPPLAFEPLTYFDGPDEVVEAAYVLAGPHRMRDLRIGAAPVTSVTDIEYELREGWPGDPLISMLRKQSRTDPVQAELRGHLVEADDGRTLTITAGDTKSSMPQVQIVATRDKPDEHQLQLIFSQGLHINGSDTERLRVPLRMRIRAIGADEWINLPELHFQAANLRQLRATIRLVWDTDADVTPEAATTEGWMEARIAAPGQTVAPAVLDWAADAYFVGTGDAWMVSANLGTTAVRHVRLDRYTATMVLDPSEFPHGRYEIDMQRGAAFRADDYVPSTYTYDGVVWDFWGVQGTPGQIVMSRDGVMDTLHLLRSVSIWNEHPLPSRDLAVVSVRARNRAVDRVSVVAGGYVRDWGGDGWDNWVVTSNPAPHLRDIYVGAENLDPVPLDLIDDEGLVVWRQHCIDMDYTVDALMEDQSVEDAARIVASCGYARPYMSDVWGVVMDYDRTDESPVQIFTPRNMSGYQWTKAFPRIPDGFRVNFRDRTRDYDTHQISVFRPGYSDDSGRMEQITVEGIVDEEKVIRKAVYDQAQAVYRNTFHSWDCASESVICRKGQLVGVAHHMIHEWHGSARVIGTTLDGTDVESIILDAIVPVSFSSFMDEVANLSSQTNLSVLGARTGVMIQGPEGTHYSSVVSVSNTQLTLDPPLPQSSVPDGAVVAVGFVGSVIVRLLVTDVSPKPNFMASITAVDEANQIWV